MSGRPVGTAEGRYRELSKQRDIYLQRARECASYTIPSLFLPEGHTQATKIPTPYQGLGARGVNTLAAKLLLTLLPPNSPFFRLVVEDHVLEQEQRQEAKAEVEAALSKYERRTMSDIETSADRVGVHEALRHLIIAGNCLLYEDKEGLRVFYLDRYVVKRDPAGKVLEIIIHETLAPTSLPEEIRDRVKGRGVVGSDASEEKTLDLFTRVKREKDRWIVYQECQGRKIPGTTGHYPLDACPWIPLRFGRIDGEDYGRSYVEELLGDLKSLEALTQAIVEGAAAAAKVLILVSPNGTTRVETIAKAENCDVVEGDANEVTVLQMDKYADFRVAKEVAAEITERLSYAFLLHSAIQRNAERVTAEEIRYMASELEDTLGGVYSILSLEFQLPYIRIKLHKLQKAGKLPQLPKGTVKPTIITGLEALGRGHDRNRLVNFGKTLVEMFGPEALSQFLNVANFITRLAASDGIDTEGLVRTEDDRAADSEQAQMMALIEQLGPDAIKALSQQVLAANKQPQEMQASG